MISFFLTPTRRAGLRRVQRSYRTCGRRLRIEYLVRISGASDNEPIVIGERINIQGWMYPAQRSWQPVAYRKRYNGRTSRRHTWLHHRDCIRCRPSAPRCDDRVAIAPTHKPHAALRQLLLRNPVRSHAQKAHVVRSSEFECDSSWPLADMPEQITDVRFRG